MAHAIDIAEIDRLFEQLLELSESDRCVRLAGIEAAAPEQARMLRRLLALAASVDTGDFRSAADAAIDDAEELPPPDIPGYRILSQLGRGGMGTVYEAVRTVHGVEQPVALKVLRAHGAGAVDPQRFVEEQSILARLQHPNIALLLDVGSRDGRAYMVMERVVGEPIDRALPPPAAVARVLDAVLQVADALQRAHDHLIVHRDIKPDNVLMDADGHVKLIDFGIARAAQAQPPAGSGGATEPLTLRYASPEQLMAQPVGVASDLYQLGLLMHALLTASWPFREDPAQRPSLRLRADAEPLPPSRCVTDPARRRQLAGDIDAIVLKCLRYDPAQRYGSATALREDILRHRGHLPLAARRPTRGYRLQQFARRHPAAVALSASLLLVLFVGVAAAFVLAARSAEYAQRSERVLDTVVGMFAPANPYSGAADRQLTVVDAVARAAERFLGEEDADPAFQVAMLQRLGDMQSALRTFDQQRRLLERALQVAAAHRLPAANDGALAAALAEAQFGQGDFEAADRTIADHGPHATAANRLRLRYVQAKIAQERGERDEAAAHFDALQAAMARTPSDALFAGHVDNSHAILLGALGRFDEAIARFDAARARLDPGRLEHQEMLLTLPMNLAVAHGRKGDYPAADREFRQALASNGERLGPEHPTTLAVARNYSTLLGLTGRFQSSYAMLSAQHDAALAVDDRIARAHFLGRLSLAAFYTGRVESALRYQVEAIDGQAASVGSDARALAGVIDMLAWMLFETGAEDDARWLATEARSRGGDSARRSLLVLALLEADDAEGSPLAATLAGDDSEPCARVEFLALRALRARVAPPAVAVPAECAAAVGLRLRALGLAWHPPWEAQFPTEPFHSTLIERHRGGASVLATAAALTTPQRLLLAQAIGGDPGGRGY
jgi:eukaryotic-like serine/threonine-protein kinase